VLAFDGVVFNYAAAETNVTIEGKEYLFKFSALKNLSVEVLESSLVYMYPHMDLGPYLKTNYTRRFNFVISLFSQQVISAPMFSLKSHNCITPEYINFGPYEDFISEVGWVAVNSDDWYWRVHIQDVLLDKKQFHLDQSYILEFHRGGIEFSNDVFVNLSNSIFSVIEGCNFYNASDR